METPLEKSWIRPWNLARKNCKIIFLQDLIKILQEYYLTNFSYKILARFLYPARKASFLVQDLQDLVQNLANLARIILARFGYFLQDSFYWEKSLPSVYFVAHLINHLSTVSIGSLYSTLKVVIKPLDINQKRLPFKTTKVSTNEINLMAMP